VHGFSPPEICFIADGADLTVREALWVLRDAGLDSIPGGGAELLSDRVRKKLSPRKIDSARWLRVMEEAHVLGMRTTATMMFGSIESPEDIVEHLDAVRGLQDRTGGFTAFIPWSFQPGNTRLAGKVLPATAVEYLRVLALSRVYLDNVPNIQASWVTQGVKTAQVALRFGANDFGSTMIEENVVAAAGVTHRVSMNDMMAAVKAAGFRPAERDTVYNILRMY
jgi:cyclic dehypoxanthinyl futalosine synthase